MIKLNELKRKDSLLFEIEDEDRLLFDEWLIDNGCSKTKKNIMSKYVRLDIVNGYSIYEAGEKDNMNIFLYRFKDIKNDINVAYKGEYAYLGDNPYIPENGTYLKYGLKGVVVPVLEKPGYINRLFKNYNINNEWNTPVIFYKGNGEKTRELKKKYGIYDLQTKGRSAAVLAFGDDVSDNKKAVRRSNELYDYEYRWMYGDDDIPRVLEYKETYDSVLIPGNKHKCPLRIIIPDSFIEENLYINGDEYTRVYIFNEEHKKMIMEYCYIKNIDRVIVTENIDYPGNEYGRYYSIKDDEYSSLMRLVYNECDRLDCLYINESDVYHVGHIMFMILGAYANAHPELSELKKGREFRFIIG